MLQYRAILFSIQSNSYAITPFKGKKRGMTCRLPMSKKGRYTTKQSSIEEASALVLSIGGAGVELAALLRES